MLIIDNHALSFLTNGNSEKGVRCLNGKIEKNEMKRF